MTRLDRPYSFNACFVVLSRLVSCSLVLLLICLQSFRGIYNLTLFR